jgi:predicted permease
VRRIELTIEGLRRDLRYAARGLRRSPAFATVAILSLAIGIGANTAIFSLVDALMWRPLPVANPDRLAIVDISGNWTLTHGQFERLRDAPSGADLSAIIRTDRYNVVVSSAGPAAAIVDEGPVRLALVSGNYFATIGVTPSIGRALTVDDDRDGAAPVAVISDAYWRGRLLRAPDVVGRRLTFTGIAYDIVGVAPPGFSGEWVGRPADVWIPITAQPRIMTEIPVGLPNAGVTAIGRLRDGASLTQMAAALQVALTRDLQAAGPTLSAAQQRMIATARIQVEPGGRGHSPQRTSFGASLTILMLAVGLVLLVACANIANLMLARAEARRRELSIRVALGANRAQLAGQLLAESGLVAATAGALGLAIARWAATAIAAFVRTDPSGRVAGLALDLDLAIDARWLAFTAAISCLAAILFGLLPAMRASAVSVAAALSARGDSASSGLRFRAGRLLVVSQVACSLVLLVGAGLFVRTLRNLSTQDLGFARDRLLLIWALPGQTGGRGAAAANYWQGLTATLEALPGVASASASNQGVLNGADAGGGSGPALRVEGGQSVQTGLPGWRSFVTPRFFETMGIPLVAGREFTERDTADAPRVVVLGQAFARHYFGDRNPVGLRIWFPEDAGAPTAIVGVAKDATSGTPREALQRPGLTYFSYRDKEAARRLRAMTIAVRTSASPLPLVPHIRRALREVDPNLPVIKIDTVDQQLADVLVQERLMAALSGFFGTIALLLACLGLYGVVSYSVGRRTSELGVRIALGATRRQVLGLVLGESVWLVLAGVAIGVPVTLAGARLVAARLYGVAATDPLTIAAAAAAMTVTAATAALIPARRASHVDPIVALRAE